MTVWIRDMLICRQQTGARQKRGITNRWSESRELIPRYDLLDRRFFKEAVTVNKILLSTVTVESRDEGLFRPVRPHRCHRRYDTGVAVHGGRDRRRLINMRRGNRRRTPIPVIYRRLSRPSRRTDAWRLTAILTDHLWQRRRVSVLRFEGLCSFQWWETRACVAEWLKEIRWLVEGNGVRSP